ncbi:magnesium-translocating P-type ATPase [Methylogaea oryzae]|uniref:Magnesium-transporting ATPase, P-type 1 n=3 Tax=Methylogaea oryzae TaxID=1295382 RepID=A0A8D4VSR1_9GAMM|nr:magnesium-translocating P-type ATPase [Methylogaea oryzae]BBL72609.1 hypothetical protein MoryE10_32150 [Methylogaea oryzae]
MSTPQPAFWQTPQDQLLQRLDSSPQGLATAEAEQRLSNLGKNRLRNGIDAAPLKLLLAQFKTPIILLLMVAAGLSFYLGDRTDGGIILGIVTLSGLLGFWQEYGAMHAVKQLMAGVRTTATVLRDGGKTEVPLEAVVPGDVVLLNAGAVVPADCRLLWAKDLFVNEAALTGETYPVEKSPGDVTADAPLARRRNCLYLGTHVVSGEAGAVVVHVGADTELGHVAGRLARQAPETEFERGVRRFGYLLTEVTLIMLVIIFALNVYLGKPVVDTFMFSLALAVGLTPQLLPAVISVNLARGAKRMAEAGVIVKRLAAIENFGSMDVLCSDKTGTLTEGQVRVHGAVDAAGRDSPETLRYAAVNAALETGFANPIDLALRELVYSPHPNPLPEGEGEKMSANFNLAGIAKLDEIPYDFLRKRLSVLIDENGEHRLVTKGALAQVLEICSQARLDGRTVPLQEARPAIEVRFQELSGQGLRVLGVAIKPIDGATRFGHEEEQGMTFLGCLVLDDPPKPGIADTVRELKSLGVALVVITGDNRLVAANLAKRIGLNHERILTGPEIRRMSDEALKVQIRRVQVFAEVEPNHKERIILALRKAGHVVGFLGDGINDASALHAADVGISVDSAVDVAKEAAHFVLLQHELAVLIDGVREGRRTFANTLKYVFMATSANFGNMFSMAGASLFLPFLPLLPKQILLTNLLTDIPEMAIATDTVDAALVEKPERWDIGFIRRFMIVFGLLSSVFDYATFGVLLHLGADAATFRTGWFLESVLSATLVVLVIRTRQPFFRSRPSRPLLAATLLVWGLVLALAYAPAAQLLGFAPLPPVMLGWLAAILALYVLAAEAAKRRFYRNAQNGGAKLASMEALGHPAKKR